VKGSHETKQGVRVHIIGVEVWDGVELGRCYVPRVTLVIDLPKTVQF
jgi:hypothetical protein